MTIRLFSLITIFTTFCLLIWGGVVHNTESSLACPDWPLCYGQFFPAMKGGILIEHGHRLLASLVGFLTVILFYLGFKNRKRDAKHAELFRLSGLALAFVIIQGILGGITVKYKLPTIVSTSHLGLSMVFFATLILIYQKSLELAGSYIRSADQVERIKKQWNPNLRMGVLISGCLLYAQILLGAFMRHSGAGAACGLGVNNSILCMDTTTWSLTMWPSWAPAQLHMVHRYFAVIVALFVIFYAFKVIGKFIGLEKVNNRFDFVGLPLLAVFFVFTQIALGIATVSWNLTPIPTTAHLAVGALCLASVWLLNLKLKRFEEEIYPEGVFSYWKDIIELTKPKLSGLVMVTALVGLLLAPEEINFFKAGMSLLLIWFVVMGAATLNCYLEKDVDGLMDRTKMRSLPAGRLSPDFALGLGVAFLLFSIPMLVVYVNFVTGLLALIAAVLYLFAYTPMKQKSELAVYVGAIPGAIPPVLGWTTVTGSMETMSWILFAILFVWQLPHFLAISIYHARDYGAANIKVYPNSRGHVATEKFIFLFTFILLLTAITPYFWGGASRAYHDAALVLSGAFLLLSVRGLFAQRKDDEHKKWARKYFWGSIFYLPLLLCAMIFLK